MKRVIMGVIVFAALAVGPEGDLRLSRSTQWTGTAVEARYFLPMGAMQPDHAVVRIGTSELQQTIIDYKNFYFWMNYIVVSSIGLGLLGVL